MCYGLCIKHILNLYHFLSKYFDVRDQSKQVYVHTEIDFFSDWNNQYKIFNAVFLSLVCHNFRHNFCHNWNTVIFSSFDWCFWSFKRLERLALEIQVLSTLKKTWSIFSQSLVHFYPCRFVNISSELWIVIDDFMWCGEY